MNRMNDGFILPSRKHPIKDGAPPSISAANDRATSSANPQCDAGPIEPGRKTHILQTMTAISGSEQIGRKGFVQPADFVFAVRLGILDFTMAGKS